MRQQHLRQNGLGDRERGKYGNFGMFVDENGDLINPLSWTVWFERRDQDQVIRDAYRHNHKSRYTELIKKNGGKDVEGELRDWAKRKTRDEAQLTLGTPIVEAMKAQGNLSGDAIIASLLAEKIAASHMSNANIKLEQNLNLADDTPLFHYPRNATGYYRGLWVRASSKDGEEAKIREDTKKDQDPKVVSLYNTVPWVQNRLEQKAEDVSLVFLPSNEYIQSYDLGTKSKNESTGANTDDYWQGIFSSAISPLSTSSQNKTSRAIPTLSLQKDVGRAAFQLYSRPIPAMTELSIIDGLVKLYDGMTTSFVSRRTDVLLRVRGVIVHGIGRISLVSSSTTAGGAMEGRRRTVLGVRRDETLKSDAEIDLSENGRFAEHEEVNVEEITDRMRHRRLQDLLNAFLSHPDTKGKTQPSKSPKSLIRDAGMLLSQIRDDAIEMYSSHFANEILSMESMKEDGWTLLQSIDDEEEPGLHTDVKNDAGHRERVLQSVDTNMTDLVAADEENDPSDDIEQRIDAAHDDVSVLHRSAATTEELPEEAQSNNPIKDNKPVETPKYVYPYPYVCDDDNGSIKKSASPAARRLPTRELALEANAANCEFEMSIDVHETAWTYGEWRNAMLNRLRMVEAFSPYLHSFDRETERLKRSQILMIKSQVGQVGFVEEDSVREALVLSMSGTIDSANCNFNSFVNVTAIRTNWEHTTAKAINYSFYMMLTCLMQIVVLLRQLLHTQAQSAASNVSLICIGWQTVLDAILCIAHIFLCLVMQPLFTAFASVAFFKLLIFCVIEMKYMALIIQARNNANNPTHTQDDLRRQITLLHLRFYAALMIAIMLFWYIGQTQRSVYVLGLYSFWVPQIILNAITEARKPMHPYYIYGMSGTRLIAPLYVFAVQKNFLKEVNPDFPSDPQMCQMLILWVFIQTAILVGQSKYGTRFMIPQR